MEFLQVKEKECCTPNCPAKLINTLRKRSHRIDGSSKLNFCLFVFLRTTDSHCALCRFYNLASILMSRHIGNKYPLWIDLDKEVRFLSLNSYFWRNQFVDALVAVALHCILVLRLAIMFKCNLSFHKRKEQEKHV